MITAKHIHWEPLADFMIAYQDAYDLEKEREKRER
jgi:hypothetical protein